MREGISPLHLPSEHTPQRKSRGKDQMAVKTNTLFLSPSQSASTNPEARLHSAFWDLASRVVQVQLRGVRGVRQVTRKGPKTESPPPRCSLVPGLLMFVETSITSHGELGMGSYPWLWREMLQG